MGFYSLVNRKLLNFNKSCARGFVYKVKRMGKQQVGGSIRWQELIAEMKKRESI